MLSLIVPVLNESPSLPSLADEIRRICAEHQLEYELIFVDDGSTDESWKSIAGIVQSDRNVRGLRFRRNFGKAAALSAGIEASRGEILFSLDADLQDDPAEIPRFLERLREGVDVVNGWKERRLDPWHKVYPSKVFNWMVSALTGLSLHDHNCGFKCFRREVARELRLYGELHRFIPVLAHARGFNVAEIAVHHRKREFGRSKYGFERFAKGFLDLLTVKFLTGYGHRPQHLLGAIGLACFGCGLLGMIYLASVWILNNAIGPLVTVATGRVWFQGHPIGSRPLLSYSVAGLLLGAQLLSLGLLAELIVSRIVGSENPYSIVEQVGRED